LNSNENAYGPSPKVVAAMQSALATANRYPFMEYDEIVERIAASHGVKAGRVVLGCGSTEILRMAAMALLGRGRQLIQASPTFEDIEHYARSAGAEVVSVPLNKEYGHDLLAMLARINATEGLVYVCNPNNPTASITPRKDVEAFVAKLPAGWKVVIDEAYHHYAGQSALYSSFVDHPLNDERVIVVRTFSKVYGLAGARLGYGITARALARQLDAYRTLTNVNGIVAQAAISALDDTESVNEFVKRNTDQRQEFFNQAMARMLKPIDSHANFVMMNTHHSAPEVIEHFRSNNILIGRRFAGMDTHIRVSLGMPEEMRQFWRVWDLWPYAQQMHH
jgi:histidinol-phosphate aminotransferase